MTQRQYAKTLGKVLLRPGLHLPGFVLKIMFGELAQALDFDGQRVLPQRLIESGFTFQHERLESRLRQCLASKNSSETTITP